MHAIHTYINKYIHTTSIHLWKKRGGDKGLGCMLVMQKIYWTILQKWMMNHPNGWSSLSDMIKILENDFQWNLMWLRDHLLLYLMVQTVIWKGYIIWVIIILTYMSDIYKMNGFFKTRIERHHLMDTFKAFELHNLLPYMFYYVRSKIHSLDHPFGVAYQ